MAPIKNARVLFVESPGLGISIRDAQNRGKLIIFASTDSPQPGKHIVFDDSQTIDVETVPLNGGILLKTLVASIDPYIRGLMFRVKFFLSSVCVTMLIVRF